MYTAKYLDLWISSVQPPAGVMRGCGLLSPPAQHPASSSATGRDLGPSCCCCTGAGTLRQHRGGRRYYIPITVTVEDHHHLDILQGYIVLCCIRRILPLHCYSMLREMLFFRASGLPQNNDFNECLMLPLFSGFHGLIDSWKYTTSNLLKCRIFQWF